MLRILLLSILIFFFSDAKCKERIMLDNSKYATEKAKKGESPLLPKNTNSKQHEQNSKDRIKELVPRPEYIKEYLNRTTERDQQLKTETRNSFTK